jgi:hypothetical protein
VSRRLPALGLVCSGGLAEWRLAADHEKVARSNRRVGEIIPGLERFERDAEPFRHLPQRVSHADFVPARGAGRDKLSLRLKWRELVRRYAVE